MTPWRDDRFLDAEPLRHLLPNPMLNVFERNAGVTHARSHEPADLFGSGPDKNESLPRSPEERAALRTKGDARRNTELWKGSAAARRTRGSKFSRCFRRREHGDVRLLLSTIVQRDLSGGRHAGPPTRTATASTAVAIASSRVRWSTLPIST